MSGIVTAAEWTAGALAAGVGAVAGGAVMLAAAGTLAWGAVAPSSQLYGRTIRRLGARAGARTGQGDGARPGIALTFDDGPNPTVTPRLLELLERYDAHATFFVIGRYVRECPALAGEIAAAGHSIGNHTDSHPDLLWMTPSAIRRELGACRDAVIGATGSAPRWMRPPYGFRGPQVAPVVRETGHEAMVMWSRLAWDWKFDTAQPVIERLRRVGNGDIVLLHDGNHLELRGKRAHNVEALEYWLPRWRDAGHRFVTVDEGVTGRNEWGGASQEI